MSDLVKKDDGGGLLGVLHGTGGLVVPKPFEREIYLFTTHIMRIMYTNIIIYPLIIVIHFM